MKEEGKEADNEVLRIKIKQTGKKEEYIQNVDRLNELEEQLCKVLPEEAVKLFEQYKSASSDLAEIIGEQDFISGCQLGVRMVMAGIDKGEAY